jgi:hypothetical protein
MKEIEIKECRVALWISLTQNCKLKQQLASEFLTSKFQLCYQVWRKK